MGSHQEAFVAPALQKDFDARLACVLFAQLNELQCLSPEPSGVVLPQHRQWLAESVRLLSERGYQAGDGRTTTREAWNEWRLRESAWREDPDLECQAALAEQTLRSLPDVLRGVCQPAEVLFSSFGRIETHFRQNRLFALSNERLAEALTAYVERRRRQAFDVQLRILEVGAGVGGTTGVVLRHLAPYEANLGTYLYTDVSPAFLSHGRRTFGADRPYIEFRSFDVARPGASQAIDVDGYDAVIAANVLHATRDIRQTVRNTKAALTSGGLLLLNEMTRGNLFTHCTFGLLPDWWAYDDASIRLPGCPGLSPERWRDVLEAAGFRDVTFPAVPLHALGLQVVYATNTGEAAEPWELRK